MKRNPAVSAQQYGAATAVLGGHSDIMPKSVAREIVDSTPKKLRSKFARQLANPGGTELLGILETLPSMGPLLPKRVKKNPLKEAEDLSEAWHGRPPEKVTVLDEVLHVHGKLVDLGGMECLEICDGEKYVIPIKFGHDVRLCSSEDGKQLYLMGGSQEIDVEPFGVEEDKDMVVLGEAAAIVYFTSKCHLGKADKIPGPYRHVFADENGERPTVLYDCRNHLILFAGGSYKIQRDMDGGRHSAGIRN